MTQAATSPTHADLKHLAELRLIEAEALYAAGMYDGCAYLSGYAVELALKAVICNRLKIPSYPANKVHKGAFAIHDFDGLLFLAGLSSDMTLANTDAALFANWSLATEWGPERRYSPAGTQTQVSALALLDAIRHVDSGVLTWLKGYW